MNVTNVRYSLANVHNLAPGLLQWRWKSKFSGFWCFLDMGKWCAQVKKQEFNLKDPFLLFFAFLEF